MNKIRMILHFARYYWKATTVYKIHSPFLYALADSLLEDNRSFYPFFELERLRKEAIRSDRKLTFEDLGAGSSNKGGHKTITTTISRIAQTAVSSPAKCRTLFRIVLWRKPEKMLEIGTSLGIAALYQHAAARNAKMITLEGIPAIAKIAGMHFEIAKAKHISQLIGHFNDTLPQALGQLGTLDYAFIDGNHRKEPVMQYFHQCLEKSNQNTVFVVDDIYWSEEMTSAWELIKNHPRVTCTIDLFYFGIVLFTSVSLPQKHHTWIPAKYKPWIMGFLKAK